MLNVCEHFELSFELRTFKVILRDLVQYRVKQLILYKVEYKVPAIQNNSEA